MLPSGGAGVATSNGDSVTNGDVQMTETDDSDKQTDAKRSRTDAQRGRDVSLDGARIYTAVIKMRKTG